MQQAESGALSRAAAVLVLVSLLRWGCSAHADAPPGLGESVLPELLESTRAAVAEGARRAEPLREGERIDPNRAPEVELDRLPGVGPTTARAIATAREEGVVFRRPEDLLAVRGIGPATLDRMRGALDLSAPPSGRAPATPAGGSSRSSGAGPTNINTASAGELESLPGVGPALAARIVAARREQMFSSLDDLTRVRGVGPATVERLRPFATVGSLR
jgi:competence ComEA-like helix-hairpin-helix protein